MMFVTVLVKLCLIADPSACVEKIVTDQATLMECGGSSAAQFLPQWMAENGYTARGYRLASWGCAMGGRRVPA